MLTPLLGRRGLVKRCGSSPESVSAGTASVCCPVTVQYSVPHLLDRKHQGCDHYSSNSSNSITKKNKKKFEDSHLPRGTVSLNSKLTDSVQCDTTCFRHRTEEAKREAVIGQRYRGGAASHSWNASETSGVSSHGDVNGRVLVRSGLQLSKHMLITQWISGILHRIIHYHNIV